MGKRKYWKRKYRKRRKRRKRGRGKSYIRKNIVYFGGRRPYLRKKKVYFGEGRKRSQRGDSIFGTILSTALPLVGEIVKVFKWKKMRRKNNYVMRRLDTLKKVTLLNGRTFYAEYQRVPRSQLPPNVIMKRKYKRRAGPKGRKRRPVRKGQWGRGFLSSLKK